VLQVLAACTRTVEDPTGLDMFMEWETLALVRESLLNGRLVLLVVAHWPVAFHPEPAPGNAPCIWNKCRKYESGRWRSPTVKVTYLSRLVYRNVKLTVKFVPDVVPIRAEP
jgi:hypothetical protein